MVTVRFTPQAWIRDYAIECDPAGPQEFAIPLKDAHDDKGQRLPDRSYESDALKDHRNAPKWIRKWSGPFDIEILWDES